MPKEKPKYTSLMAVSIHLGVSILIAAGVAWLVFYRWFPAPYHEITKGTSVFFLLIGVDVVCGPFLTWVLYRPEKPRYQWNIDLAIIVFIQCGALAYGLQQLSTVRPVWIAFEIDRIRVVQWLDIGGPLEKRPPVFSLNTPQWIGVEQFEPHDPRFIQSVKMSLEGNHPAFQPDRWVDYNSQKDLVRGALRSIEKIYTKDKAHQSLIDAVLQNHGLEVTQIGYIPLVCDSVTDWVVLIRKDTLKPIKTLHIDGW
jgi:hypothetical protein